ncbi:hypothetical protein GWI33_001039, partial [Rhynchophorus ferrugineus]
KFGHFNIQSARIWNIRWSNR